ncbi:hypothetical protein HanPSC8_Chr09g0379661 [Helianthus annuus]|nr:hypothetical protein HanPSC8_Chr09g0379661 [Helianthus annuus]
MRSRESLFYHRQSSRNRKLLISHLYHLAVKVVVLFKSERLESHTLVEIYGYCYSLIKVLRGTWGRVRREKTKWLELGIRSLNKIAIWILNIFIFVKTIVWF